MTECWSSCSSFFATRKLSEADSFRLSAYAIKIAEALGLDPESTEDLRTAALLRNVNEIGISNEILYKAANLSEEELEKGMRKAGEARRNQSPVDGWIAAPRHSHPGGGPAIEQEWSKPRGFRRRSADPESGGEVRVRGRRAMPERHRRPRRSRRSRKTPTANTIR